MGAGVRGGLPLGLGDPGRLGAGELRFEEALAGAAGGGAGGGLGLAQLRELSARRAEALRPPAPAEEAGARGGPGEGGGGGGSGGGGGGPAAERFAATGRYLSLLSGLAAQAGRLPALKGHKNRLGQLREAVSWSSPLLDGPQTKRQYGLAGLPQEWGMACMLYAARMRERGLEGLSALDGEGGDAGGAAPAGQEVLAEAASWLRRASGAYRFCEAEPLPKIRMHLPGERPAEAMPSMADSMATLCLAEAQCLVATRALQRGSTGQLVAALYVGASELFEAARNTLKKNVGDFNKLSERLMRYLAVSSAIATGRALSALALECKAEEKLGEAVGLAQLALSKVKQTQVVCEICPEWRSECASEVRALQNMCNRLEQENRIVHFQKVSPATDRALPAGKILVKPIDFDMPKEEKQAFFLN